VLNHRAEPVEILTSPAGASLTNLCFGGPEMKTLFMTESVSGTVLKAEMTIAGPLPNRAKQAV
jgi:gluconolactonase